jgi:phytoene synthase
MAAHDIDALYQAIRPRRLRRPCKPVKSFGLRREDFLAIVDGMEMDAAGHPRARHGHPRF